MGTMRMTLHGGDSVTVTGPFGNRTGPGTVIRASKYGAVVRLATEAIVFVDYKHLERP